LLKPFTVNLDLVSFCLQVWEGEQQNVPNVAEVSRDNEAEYFH